MQTPKTLKLFEILSSCVPIGGPTTQQARLCIMVVRTNGIERTPLPDKRIGSDYYEYLIQVDKGHLSKLESGPTGISGGNLAPSLGWLKNFSRTKMTLFSEKISILAANIFDFFLVIDQVFRIFTDPLLDVVYDPSYTTLSSQEKPLFYSFHTFAHIQQHYTSQNIGGTNAWAVPPPQTLGDRPPSSP